MTVVTINSTNQARNVLPCFVVGFRPDQSPYLKKPLHQGLFLCLNFSSSWQRNPKRCPTHFIKNTYFQSLT